MINKLYNLKKMQTQQQLVQKQQLLSNISSIEDEIEVTYKSIATSSVQSIGAISDFRVLEIHKNTMKAHIEKLNIQKSQLVREVEKFNKIIIELNKETEQFKYIKDQINKEELKKVMKAEEETSAEYVQANWKAS
jgi:hypothetical protein